LQYFLFFPSVSCVQARGQTIRRQREQSGYGLRAFAQLVEVSPSWLSRIETGKANPSPDVIKRIALALRKERNVRAAIEQIANPEEGSDEHRNAVPPPDRQAAGCSMADD
jgi:transcriptional regulator with XRE-family HTH domain